MVFQQVLSSVEKEAVAAAQTDEQVSTTIGKEHSDHYPIILLAQGMLSMLNALKDKMDAEKLQSDAEEDRKEDRKFLLEERQRKSLEDKEDRKFLLEQRARKPRTADDE